MTTDDDVKSAESKQKLEKTGANSNEISTARLPPEIMDIMEYLSLNNKIVFKSQQRNEPELLQSEKIKVATDIYQRNPQTFLIRFGSYLQEQHLSDFARLSVANSDAEMHLMIKDYQQKIKTRQQDVKNRRYAALQNLIKAGEYFSEQEMMKRSPELYQELVGQYLSREEKQLRDSYDVKNTTFSGILMHTLEQKEISEIMEKAEEQVNRGRKGLASTTGKSSEEENDNLEKEQLDDLPNKVDEVPVSYRQQWGNFDNEQVACSSSKIQKPKSPKKKAKSPMKMTADLITADERRLLRQEFVSQMHEQFLTGQDKEFDYTTVDDNTQFDDLKILNQDREDKYFEESDDESDEEVQRESKEIHSNQMDVEESEDELDLYMSHLNKHHSLQK